MEEMQLHFMIKAGDILCQCRQTLEYSSVFTFFLKTNHQGIIFDDNQQDL